MRTPKRKRTAHLLDCRTEGRAQPVYARCAGGALARAADGLLVAAGGLRSSCCGGSAGYRSFELLPRRVFVDQCERLRQQRFTRFGVLPRGCARRMRQRSHVERYAITPDAARPTTASSLSITMNCWIAQSACSDHELRTVDPISAASQLEQFSISSGSGHPISAVRRFPGKQRQTAAI